MALIACPDCSREVSAAAASCPHCGHPLQHRGGGGGFWKVLSVLLLVALVAVVAAWLLRPGLLGAAAERAGVDVGASPGAASGDSGRRLLGGLLGSDDPDTLRYLPAESVVAWSTTDFDLARTWRSWRAAIGRIDEQALAEIDSGLTQLRAEQGVDLERDLVGLLRGEAAWAITVSDLDSLAAVASSPGSAPSDAELVLVAGCTDVERFNQALDRLLGPAGGSRSSAPTAAGDAWILRLPGGSVPALHYAVHEGRLVATLSRPSLEAALSRFEAGGSLADDAGFASARGHLPDEATAIGWIDLPEIGALAQRAGMISALTSMAGQPTLVDELLGPRAVPFGMAWTVTKVDGGLKRTAYGPDSLVGRLPMDGIAAILPFTMLAAAESLQGAVGSGYAKRTMADVRTIATVVESYAIDNNEYPKQDPPGSVEAIRDLVEPTYVKKLPLTDAWDEPFLYWSDGVDYVIASGAADRALDAPRDSYAGGSHPAAGGTSRREQDIVFSVGSFAQWPEGTQY